MDVRFGYLFAILMIVGLTGCKNEHYSDIQDISQTDAYKEARPAEVKDLDDSGPKILDVRTGKPLDTRVTAGPDPDKIPTPDEGVASIDPLESLEGEATEGEKHLNWRGLMDIYWKLNWVRKELLSSNVPKDLRVVVARTRRHSLRIRKSFSDRSVTKYLDIVDSSLDALDAGMDQMVFCNQMTRANIAWRTLPWNATENLIQRELVLQGLMPQTNDRSSSSFYNKKDDDDSVRPNPYNSIGKTGAVISTDRRAIAQSILEYAHKHHVSPEEGARTEFEKALKDVVRLRNKIDEGFALARPSDRQPPLRTTKPSVPGDDYIISGNLRQEPGSRLERPRKFSLAGTDSEDTSGIRIP